MGWQGIKVRQVIHGDRNLDVSSFSEEGSNEIAGKYNKNMGERRGAERKKGSE